MNLLLWIVKGQKEKESDETIRFVSPNFASEYIIGVLVTFKPYKLCYVWAKIEHATLLTVGILIM